MKVLIALFLGSLCFPSMSAHAAEQVSPPLRAREGGGSHGTEREALLRLLVEKGGPDARKRFDENVQRIETYISSGQLKAELLLFVRQVSAAQIADPQVAKVYKDLLSQGLVSEVESLRVEVSSACRDWQGIPRESATEKRRGATVCFDPFLIELLGRTKEVGEIARESETRVFGLAMHELARHFMQDDSHEFLVGMWKEARAKILLRHETCRADSAAVCVARPVVPHERKVLGWRMSVQEPKLRAVVQLEQGKNFKNCLKSFVVATGFRQFRDRGDDWTEPTGPALVPTGKPGQVAIEFDLRGAPEDAAYYLSEKVKRLEVHNLYDLKLWRKYHPHSRAPRGFGATCPTYTVHIEDMSGRLIAPAETMPAREVVPVDRFDRLAWGDLFPPQSHMLFIKLFEGL